MTDGVRIWRLSKGRTLSGQVEETTRRYASRWGAEAMEPSRQS